MSLFQRFKQPKSDPGTTPPTKAPKITDKRREQLRKAQRTHRERSKAYQEALEQEIILLRAKDSKALQAYKAENAFLRQLLAHHNIPVPDTKHFVAENVETRVQIDAKYPNRASLQLQSTPMAPDTAINSMLSDFSLSPADSTTTSHMNGPSPEPTAIEPSLLEIGVNFVLYLEHPCMQHPHLLSADQPNNNHAFLPSTALLQFASQPPQEVVQKARSGGEVTWLSPTSQLDNLLTMSQQFVPEGEIAPVQMWQQVKAALDAHSINLESIPALQHQLGAYVECRGFGAAMERDDFDKLLYSLRATQ